MLFIGISANIAPGGLLSAMAPWSAWRNLIERAVGELDAVVAGAAPRS